MKIGEQSEEPQISKAVQTEPVLEEVPRPEPPFPGPNGFEGGTLANPFTVEDEDLDPHDAISDDEDNAPELVEPPNPIDDDKYFFGTAFEKADEFDNHLDDPNPWHPDLKRPLFDSQIIGFRWMASRHSKGGGLIGDKVGCGKVTVLYLTLGFSLSKSRHTKRRTSFSGSKNTSNSSTVSRNPGVEIFAYWSCSIRHS